MTRKLPILLGKHWNMTVKQMMEAYPEIAQDIELDSLEARLIKGFLSGKDLERYKELKNDRPNQTTVY